MPDRRLAGRHDAWLPFEIAGREGYTNDYIENLSIGGAYVRTLEPAALRTRLKIAIVAPKSRRTFHFDAEVMRVIEPEQSASAGLPPGMGVSFLDLGGGDPRPRAVEILNELRALDDDQRPRADVEIDDAEAGDAAAPPARMDATIVEAFGRLEQFLQQARGQNYYEILGVDAAAATPQAVKKHYHRRSKEFHPDRFHHARTPEIDSKVEELYGLLTKAYETLRDPAKREAYDRTHGIRATVEFRRAAAKSRADEALAQAQRGRTFSAVVGLKVALSLDPGNPDLQRKLEELERPRKFFLT